MALKGVLAEKAEELGQVMQRIYDSDPEKFKSLIRWRNLYLALGQRDEEKKLISEGEGIELVIESLRAFERRREHEEIEGHWWPYLATIYNNLRAKRIQSQSAKYKQGGFGLSSLADILKKAGFRNG